MEPSVAVLCTAPLMRKRVMRALSAAGTEVTLCEDAGIDKQSSFDLFLVDCDTQKSVELIDSLSADIGSVVFMSTGAELQTLERVLARHAQGHLIARHNGVGPTATAPAADALFDEQELRVTCEKVLGGDIFGLDKYISSWGVAYHRTTIRGAQDKYRLLEAFEAFLRALECPHSVVPDMVTVADELVTNAMVHGPRTADGSEKYAAGPAAAAELEPSEYVDVTYASDGARIGIAVGDNFGTLSRETVHTYVKRALQAQMVPESKSSGPGLGIALSLRCNHQFVFNVHEGRRTEVIAGWDLRARNGSEFRRLSKSLGVFWLSRDQVSTQAERRIGEGRSRDQAERT